MAGGLEIERRFLIRRPSLSALGERYPLDDSAIEQTYLLAEPGISAERVRARATRGETVYTHTSKIRIAHGTAIEREETVSPERYRELLLRRDPERMTLEKRRISFPYGGHTVEIDLYPFSPDVAILEIELAAIGDDCPLPPELDLICEITGDKRFSNHALSKVGRMPQIT